MISDLTRYHPYFVGAKNFFDEIELLAHGGSNYPPYNIIEHSENNYTVEFALAGFKKEQITVTQEKGHLIIEGEFNIPEEDEKIYPHKKTYIHKGIASRDFKNKFRLLENVKVISANFVDGVLSIKLEKEIPESEKAKVIEIKAWQFSSCNAIIVYT